MTVDKALIQRASRLLRILAPSHMPVILDAITTRADEALTTLNPQADLWQSLLDAGDDGPLGPSVQAEAERYGVPAEEIRQKFVAKRSTDPSFEKDGVTSAWLRAAYRLSKLAVKDRHCYFATEETSALVTSGANDAIERVAATIADLPSPSGIAYFDRSRTVAGFFLLWGTGPDGIVQAGVCSAPMMMSWLETEPATIPDGLGFRALPFRQAKMSPADTDDAPTPIEVHGSMTMTLDNGEQATPLTEDPLDALAADHAIPILLSFTHMMRQHKLIDVASESHSSRAPADRKGRRRARTDTITYMSYRPPTIARPGTYATRNYSHRWVVRGHWRRQWYPTQNRHIPIWITEYIVGPDDAPIQVRDKVTIARAEHGS